MTLMMLIAFLTAAAGTPAKHAMPSIDCQAERVALLSSIKPVVTPDATLETLPDNDPSTVQFFVVSGVPANSGSVTDDGQVIFLPASATSGPDADDTIGARLFAHATDKLLSLKIGNVCHPIQVPAGGT